MNFTKRQTLLMKALKKQGVIKIREARITKTMSSLKLLAQYGYVTGTMEGFCLSPKGYRETEDWDSE